MSEYGHVSRYGTSFGTGCWMVLTSKGTIMHVTVEKMLLDILNFQEPQDIYGRHNATCIVDIGA